MPNNFRFPYAAIGFSDFWRRWHISLSTWLRDYLYIPLGGNRKGNIRTYVNLMTTMLLGGLWHGASWTFVVWGGLHGLYLAAERFLTARFHEAAFVRMFAFRIAMGLVTYFLVNITWVFFRAQDFPTARRILSSMFGANPEGIAILSTIRIVEVTVVIATMLAVHWKMRERTLEDVVAQTPWWLTGTIWAAMLFAIIIAQGGGSAFIYFQF